MIPAQSIRFSLLAPLIGFLAFQTDAWADTDCTSDIADRQSVSTYSALLDGQPGVAGQPQLSASAGLNRESFKSAANSRSAQEFRGQTGAATVS